MNENTAHKSGEGPDVATDPVILDRLFGDVLLLAANEAPDFIDLNALRLDVANGRIMELRTGRANALKQAKDGTLRYARHADCRADRAAFNGPAQPRNMQPW